MAVRGGGKFRPKPKDPTITSSKSFTAVIPPGGMVPVQKTQPPPPAASKDAEFVPLPFVAQLFSSQIEGLVDRSPLCNALTNVSLDLLTIIFCSSAPLDPSCKVVAQDAVDLVEVEHSGVAVSDANEKTQMNDERLGKQVLTHNLYITFFIFITFIILKLL